MRFLPGIRDALRASLNLTLLSQRIDWGDHRAAGVAKLLVAGGLLDALGPELDEASLLGRGYGVIPYNARRSDPAAAYG